MKDANGLFVGVVVDGYGRNDALVGRPLGGQFVRIAVTGQGFIENGDLLFDTVDCTGATYASVGFTGGGMFGLATVRKTSAYIATGPDVMVTIRAYASNESTQASCEAVGGTFSSNLCCIPKVPPFSYTVTPVTSFNLTTLGLVPPFHVEGP